MKVTFAVPFTTKPLFAVMLVPAWKQKAPKLIVVADGFQFARSFVQPATEMGGDRGIERIRRRDGLRANGDERSGEYLDAVRQGTIL
jgi:hypothetical protein